MQYLGLVHPTAGFSTTDSFVTLFEHSDFGGRSWRLYPGYHSDFAATPDLPNDRVSSVYVPPGLMFSGWEHKEKGGAGTGPLRNPPGAGRELNGHNVSYYGLNDKISSAEVVDEAAIAAAEAAERARRQAEAAAAAAEAAAAIEEATRTIEESAPGVSDWQSIIAPPPPPAPPDSAPAPVPVPATDAGTPTPMEPRRSWWPWAAGGILLVALTAYAATRS